MMVELILSDANSSVYRHGSGRLRTGLQYCKDQFNLEDPSLTSRDPLDMAEMAIQIQAARLLVYDAAFRLIKAR
jgi:hypothetical protein